MGCCNREIIPNADCPVCGKKEGACLGKSDWRHSVSCCSDECGLLLKEKLQALRSDTDMIMLQHKLQQAKNLITQMLEKVAGTTDLHFELNHWL